MDIYFLLDRSGSMILRWEESIVAINSYVQNLAESKETKKAKVTVAAFDSYGELRVRKMRRKQKAKDWQELTPVELRPTGMTPLLDAIMHIGNWIEEDKPEQATIIIITDGQENASKEASYEDVRAVLDGYRNKGFDVSFIGADLEDMKDAADLGNASSMTISMNSGSYASTMLMKSSKTIRYASSGSVEEFTDEDRAVARGAKPNQ